MTIAEIKSNVDQITVHPGKNTFSAEIRGINLQNIITDAAFSQIYQAFLDHKVLFFRNQPLDDESHLAFAERFGELDIHINRDTHLKGHPKVQVFSNQNKDGTTTGEIERGTLIWHTDKSYTPTPSLTTILRSPKIAGVGGSTMFADMSQGYASLSIPLKEKIENLNAIHSWKRSREKSKDRPATDSELAAAPPVEHPIVRTHPETGRQALYIGNHASHVAGMDISEGESLLQELEQHATKEEFVYRHQWQVNDILMWDNRCTLHCVEPYDPIKEARTVHRVVVKGDKPFRDILFGNR